MYNDFRSMVYLILGGGVDGDDGRHRRCFS